MEVYLDFLFSSRGTFRTPVFGHQRWQNQYGSGYDLELNLIWFHFSLEFYVQKPMEKLAHEQILRRD